MMRNTGGEVTPLNGAQNYAAMLEVYLIWTENEFIVRKYENPYAKLFDWCIIRAKQFSSLRNFDYTAAA